MQIFVQFKVRRPFNHRIEFDSFCLNFLISTLFEIWRKKKTTEINYIKFVIDVHHRLRAVKHACPIRTASAWWAEPQTKEEEKREKKRTAETLQTQLWEKETHYEEHVIIELERSGPNRSSDHCSNYTGRWFLINGMVYWMILGVNIQTEWETRKTLKEWNMKHETKWTHERNQTKLKVITKTTTTKNERSFLSKWFVWYFRFFFSLRLFESGRNSFSVMYF